MKYLLIALIGMSLLLSPVFAADQVYVKSNASLEEVIPPEPFVVTSAIKAKLADEAPIHPVYGVKYITKHIAKLILKCSGAEARQVIDALVADGIIKTASERYAELYPPEETP